MAPSQKQPSPAASLHAHHPDGLVRDRVGHGGDLGGEGPHREGLGARTLRQQQGAQEALVVAPLNLNTLELGCNAGVI